MLSVYRIGHPLYSLCFPKKEFISSILYPPPQSPVGLHQTPTGLSYSERDGPPTTVLATMSTLMGAAGEAAAWCVSCRHLVTDWGTSALLTMACTFALPLPPILYPPPQTPLDSAILREMDSFSGGVQWSPVDYTI